MMMKKIKKQAPAPSRKLWTQEEDQLLQHGIRQHGSNWIKIAEFIPGRNASQCVQRWKRIKPQESHRNVKWTEQEDVQVIQLVAQYGNNWKMMSAQLPQRTGRQIRERYVNHLNPGIDKSEWKASEDKQIWEMYNSIGTKWCVMARKLKGRTENQIKNRFYSHIRNCFGRIQNPYYIIPTQTNKVDLPACVKPCKLEAQANFRQYPLRRSLRKSLTTSLQLEKGKTQLKVQENKLAEFEMKVEAQPIYDQLQSSSFQQQSIFPFHFDSIALQRSFGMQKNDFQKFMLYESLNNYQGQQSKLNGSWSKTPGMGMSSGELVGFPELGIGQFISVPLINFWSQQQ